MCEHGRNEYELCAKCDPSLIKLTLSGVIDEVKGAVMTENVNLKKRLDVATQLIKDFPGHFSELEWNAWLFRRDEFIRMVQS